MKNKVLPALLFFAFNVSMINAQSLKLYYQGKEVSNSTHYINYDSSSEEIFTGFDMTSTKTVLQDVKVKKIIKQGDTISGAELSFGWGCFWHPHNVYESSSAVTILPSEVMGEIFLSFFVPNGTTGKNTVTYVFYDEFNKTDSVWVNIVYDMTTGIEKPSLNTFKVYPNPAGKLLYVNLPSQADNLNISLSDITGKVVQNFWPQQGVKNDQLVLNLEEVRNGIYFLAVSNELGYFAQKIVVNN